MAIEAWAERVASLQVTASSSTKPGSASSGWPRPIPTRTETSWQAGQADPTRPLAADGATAYDFLHPNARALIDRIASAGVGTVVLDECHHLLDYWAIVLRALICRLDQPYVVGLTATLPSLEDADEYENYTALLGDVDFEVPTPAVIKEGDLAPFRDLAWWVRPTESEAAFLRDVHGRFLEAVDATTASPGFARWLGELLPSPR